MAIKNWEPPVTVAEMKRQGFAISEDVPDHAELLEFTEWPLSKYKRKNAYRAVIISFPLTRYEKKYVLEGVL